MIKFVAPDEEKFCVFIYVVILTTRNLFLKDKFYEITKVKDLCSNIRYLRNERKLF